MKGGIPAFVACGALSLIVCGCSENDSRNVHAVSRRVEARENGNPSLSPSSPALQQIRVAVVETRQIRNDVLSAPGKVEVNPNRVSRVVMPVPGRVRSVLVRLGDAVDEGQPLLTLQSPEADSAMAASSQAEARLRQAISSQAKAEKDLARTKDLYEHRAGALKDVTSAENDMVQAEAFVQQSRAELQAARGRLELLGLEPATSIHEVTVRAPMAGKVMEIAVASGEYRNDTAANLMTIADLSTVWITSNVPEASIRLVQVGEPVLISLSAFPGESFTGRVTRIAGTVDAETRTVKVHAELPNPRGRFLPEMFGNIVHSHGTRVVPVVPAGAVVQSEQGPIVYQERSPGVFEKVKVVVEDPRDGFVPILGGLTGGERVVVDGAVLLGR